MKKSHNIPSTIVFGANGQDGFFMCRYLLKKNFMIIAVVNKNDDKVILLKKKYKENITIIKYSDKANRDFNFLINYKLSTVYFFAGFSKIPSNSSEKLKCIQNNYIFFKNYLYFIKKNKLKHKIIYLSSGEIFGNFQIKKKTESSELNSQNCYGRCKIKSYQLIKKFKKNYNFFITTCICYNHESLFTPKNHLIRILIKKLLDKKKVVTVFNDQEFRNLSHVNDFIPIFFKCAQKKISNEFIFANNKNFKIIDILNKLKFLLKTDNKINVIVKKNSNISRQANNSKIKIAFRYQPNFDIDRLLKRFISYEKKKLFIYK
tara:strand:- start:557 stop:1510 length:954 start_codon:yes stop_codon:yes gene_type:complete